MINVKSLFNAQVVNFQMQASRDIGVAPVEGE